MDNNEQLFPKEQFQPILERSMALDDFLQTEDKCMKPK